MDDILHHLKELGFNTYESKVYLSLLKHHPSTGYEVSKESGVPQARAYDTLKVLENRKIVVGSGTKPITYVPINPEELLKRSENNFKKSVNFLKDNLPTLSDDFVEPVMNIRGTAPIVDQMIELIKNAEKEIFLEIWNEDFVHIKDALKEAEKRGISIKIVGYNDLKTDFGLVYQHGLGTSIEECLGGRWIILTTDNKQGIAGTLSEKDSTPQAVCTRNAGLVLIMKEVIVHDMFLLDVESKLGDSLSQVYGQDLIHLREKILGPNFELKTH